MRASVLVSFLVCALALFSFEVRALTIDDFEDAGSVTANGTQTVGSAYVPSTSAAGGGRAMRAFYVSGSAEVELKTVGGSLLHIQDPGTLGQSFVTWDGDSIAGNLLGDGLAGIDMYQDAGNALTLTISFFDRAAGEDLPLEVRVYDAADPAGLLESRVSLVLNMSISAPTDYVLPFSSFVPVGLLGGADFHNIGALAFKVAAEDPAFDLVVDRIASNGYCPLVPDIYGRVVDDCGVCGGDNSTKDVCGVCGGNGSTCLDCNGVPNGGAVNDVCGICGGDGTSCLDCDGVPFGPAAPDRCGVCGGNESTCCICTEHNNSAAISAMKASAKKQYKALVTAAESLLRNARAEQSKYKATSKKLYRQLLKCIGRVPRVSLSCEEGPACEQDYANSLTVTSCTATSRQLHGLSSKIVKASIAATPKGGKCTGTAAECQARAKARIAARNAASKDSRSAYKQTVKSSGKVPKVTSNCNGRVVL